MKAIEKYKPYYFQSVSIENGISILNKYNSLLLTSDTGLGKTIVAATIAANIAVNKVLIIAPNATKKAWEQVMSVSGVDYEITGNRAIPEYTKTYDLIIIDEVHKIGTAEGKTFLALAKLILFNKEAKVIAISATPYNNNITAFTDIVTLLPMKDKVVKLMLNSVITKMNQVLYEYNTLNRYGQSLSTIDVNRIGAANAKVGQLTDILGGIVGNFTIRDERTNIEILPTESLLERFPKVIQHSVEYTDPSSFANVDMIINMLNRAKYTYQNQINYFNSDGSGGFGAVYRTTLFKLLESSFEAFKNSIGKNITNITSILDSGIITIGTDNYSINDKPNFFSDLESDLIVFNQIKEYAENLNDGVKLGRLFDLISQNCGKIVVFTEYNDTFGIICKHLSDNNINYISYNSQTDEKVLDTIAANFDANNPKIQDKYRVLVCTDTLAEGVNLHAANAMIHFDNKWNPSKVIQREGRINRINIYENNHEVNIYTFQTPSFVDAEILLTNRINDKETDAHRLYEAMRNPINISSYINKIDTIVIGNHNKPDAVSGQAYILGNNEYVLFSDDYIPSVIDSNTTLYVNQLFQQMDDAILSEKTTFNSYSEYKDTMLNYPKDRRFGNTDWMYGYKDFFGSIRTPENSLRIVKKREFESILNTIDTSGLNVKMLRTAFDMQAYGYVLYKIYESIHKSKFPIKTGEKIEIVLLDIIKEFSLFLQGNGIPYLMVGKRYF